MKHNLVNLIRCLKPVLQIVLYMYSHFTYSVKYYIIPLLFDTHERLLLVQCLHVEGWHNCLITKIV